uniref:PM19_00185 n=1 Tax=Apple proliferation phytoplasma TaxID=37692 RepID=A0A5B8YVV6_APPPP|nr:PM19_00185 [Candidatus Phytoplasma mali]
MVKNLDLQTFLFKKNKKIFIIVISILFLIILVIGLYKIYNSNYFSTNKPISSESNQGKDESNKLIHEVYVKEGEELKQIKEYLQQNIFNKYSYLKSNKSTLCELFSFSTFNPPTYNSIDKKITGSSVVSEEQTNYIVQPGMFGCPIKDPPGNLIAVYFDGGLRRGGDEEEDEEGNEIPRYTLEDLKTMHNGGTIYIFYKK